MALAEGRGVDTSLEQRIEQLALNVGVGGEVRAVRDVQTFRPGALRHHAIGVNTQPKRDKSFKLPCPPTCISIPIPSSVQKMRLPPSCDFASFCR